MQTLGTRDRIGCSWEFVAHLRGKSSLAAWRRLIGMGYSNSDRATPGAKTFGLMAIFAAVHFGLGHLAGGNQRAHTALRQRLAVPVHARPQAPGFEAIVAAIFVIVGRAGFLHRFAVGTGMRCAREAERRETSDKAVARMIRIGRSPRSDSGLKLSRNGTRRSPCGGHQCKKMCKLAFAQHKNTKPSVSEFTWEDRRAHSRRICRERHDRPIPRLRLCAQDAE